MPPSTIRMDGPPTQSARPPIGGSAVLEGVMLCSAQAVSVAVRRPSGEVVSRVRPRRRRGLLVWSRRVFLLRGIAAFVEHSLLYGSAFFFALCQADLLRPLPGAAVGSHTLPGFAPSARRRWRTWRLLLAWLFWAALGAVLVLGGVPVIFADFANNSDALGLPSAALVRGLCALMGVLGSVMLLTGYINLVGHSSSFSRLLGYHGAEHQVRAAYLAGAPLTLGHIRRYPAIDSGCVMGRAVMLTLVGFGVTAVLGRMVPPLGAVLAAADASWPQLLGATCLRGLGVILAAGPYGELRRLARCDGFGRLHAGLCGPAAWLCCPSLRQPCKKMSEVAYLALLRLIDTEDAAALGGFKAQTGFGKLADACVRSGHPNDPAPTPRFEGDAL